MTIGTILLIILLLIFIGVIPHWGYSRSWGLGWGPGGAVGLLLLVVIILVIAKVI